MKNLFILAITVMMVFLIMGCDRVQYENLTGPTDPNDPPNPPDTIVTVTDVTISPDTSSKHTLIPGEKVQLFGKMDYVSPNNMVTTLSDNTGDCINLGMWTSTSSWADFPIKVRAYPDIVYGIALQAETPEGYSYPLDLGFHAQITYSNGNVVTVPLNRIYLALGNLVNGKRLNFGYFVGFKFNEAGEIEAVGDWYINQLTSMCISFDSISSITANGANYYNIPADSLGLYQQNLEIGVEQIIQCSYNNYKRMPRSWNETLQRHEFWIKTVPGCEHNFLIASEEQWIEKKFGVNATIGNTTQELMNIWDFDPSTVLWKLFNFRVTETLVPQNIVPVDCRRGTVYNVIPG